MSDSMNSSQVQVPARRIGPSRWLHLIGVALIVIGLFGGYKAVLNFIQKLNEGVTRAIFPGEVVVTFPAPGEYKIYYESQSELNGRVFDTRESVQGLEFVVSNTETGETIPLSHPRIHETYQINERRGQALFRFNISSPGQYKVAAHYDSDAKEQSEGVFAVGNIGILKAMLLLFAGIGCIFVLAGGGLATIVLVEVKRSSQRRKLQAAEVAAAAHPSIRPAPPAPL